MNDSMPKVTKTKEDAMIDGTGTYVAAIQVEFRVGDQGPFTVKIPKSEFSAQRVRQEMDAFAAQLAQLLG